MIPLRTLAGPAAALRSCGSLVANVDTDTIIPKQFLKSLTRKGLARGLFFDLKYREDGSPDPDFILNRPVWKNSVFLIAGENFGCGSSREHAPWALLDHGIQCVIAPSFADIFRNNCFKNAIAPIPLPLNVCENLARLAAEPENMFKLDMKRLILTDPEEHTWPVNIEPDQAKALIEGLDDIGTTMQYSSDIEKFEQIAR